MQVQQDCEVIFNNLLISLKIYNQIIKHFIK